MTASTNEPLTQRAEKIRVPRARRLQSVKLAPNQTSSNSSDNFQVMRVLDNLETVNADEGTTSTR